MILRQALSGYRMHSVTLTTLNFRNDYQRLSNLLHSTEEYRTIKPQ
jgi:hypothetical protein